MDLKNSKKEIVIKKPIMRFFLYGQEFEKVFEELKQFFQIKIKIFSSDYLSKKKQSENLIDEISEEKIDILVGTQMISKGLISQN